jgi:hypothetical protein
MNESMAFSLASTQEIRGTRETSRFCEELGTHSDTPARQSRWLVCLPLLISEAVFGFKDRLGGFE